MGKKIFFSLFILILLAGAFSAGSFWGKLQVVCPVCQPQDIDFSLFWEAHQKLQDKFADKDKLDPQSLIYGAISGMVKSLGDDYTVFFPPQETKRFIEDVKGSFEGVGMEIGIRDGQLQVVSPLEGTPAFKAGLRPGDKILAVNGTSTSEITIEEAVNLIRGPRGTEVVLTIFRKEWKESREIKIVREVIAVPSLILEIREDNIAHLKLYQFSEKASRDFNRAASKILENNPQGIILDLRNNPGGYLEVAQDIAGWFLEKGQIVAIEDFGGGQEEQIYRAQGNSKLLAYPLVVLINQGSASGAEILAGALRDNQSVKLVGETSFGKGSVQELERLRGGSSLKITIAKWLTPNREHITGKGLEPDFTIEITEEDYEEGNDPQLIKALEIIKGLK